MFLVLSFLQMYEKSKHAERIKTTFCFVTDTQDQIEMISVIYLKIETRFLTLQVTASVAIAQRSNRCCELKDYSNSLPWSQFCTNK